MAKKNDEERISQDIKAPTSRYRPLDSSGNDYASMVGMSDLDRAALDAASQSWNEANAAKDQAGMDAAHRQAESIRLQYGYSGGGDGSQYIPTGAKKEEFSYTSAPTYTNRYQSQIDDLTRQILNREAFSYDPEKDPTYQQYKESYKRSGERAMQDTLGQISARTGGLASSYAGSAAQQTYDNYMGALADKIPELKQLAYSMYQDEGNTQRANLEMLVALEQGDYAKYADLLAQYNTDRSFDYGVHRDNISDERYNNEWNYSVGRDQIADKRYDQEYADSRADVAFSKDLEKAQTLAAAGDFSGYKALGYTDQEIAGLKSAYNKAQAAVYSSSRSSGGGGGSDSGDSETQNSNIYQALKDGGATDYGTAYAMLLSSGYGVTAAKELATYFADTWLGSQGDEVSDSDAQIGNRHGDSWIYIPGHGRFTYDEVENYVNSGKVIETYDSKTNTYTYEWYTNKK